MESILHAFANENLVVGPSSFSKHSAEGRAVQKLCDMETALNAVLNDKEKELLEQLEGAQREISSLSSTEQFLYGYRLGVLMTTEVFTGYPSLILGE